MKESWYNDEIKTEEDDNFEFDEILHWHLQMLWI